MARLMRIIRDTVLILMISLGILVLGELGLSIIFPEKVKLSNPFKPFAYVYHPEYFLKLRPNAEGEFQRKKENGGQQIRWKTNSDSFRGPELNPSPNYRIIVYGDSNIQARFSEWEHTYAARLNHYLEESSIQGTEVLNAGIVGFGPDQQYLRFADEVDRYKPEMVIFNIFADNDFGDLIRNQIYRFNELGEFEKTTLKRKAKLQFIDSKKARLRVFTQNLLLTRSLQNLLNLDSQDAKERKEYPSDRWYHDKEYRDAKVQELCKIEYEQYLVFDSTPNPFWTHYDLDVATAPSDIASITKINLMEAVLTNAHGFAQSKGVHFFVLIQPSSFDMTMENGVLNYEYLKKYPAYERTNLTATIQNICEKHKIPYLNLFPIFEDNDPETLYFRAGDNHWNDRGQDLAAKSTASQISDSIKDHLNQ